MKRNEAQVLVHVLLNELKNYQGIGDELEMLDPNIYYDLLNDLTRTVLEHCS